LVLRVSSPFWKFSCLDRGFSPYVKFPPLPNPHRNSSSHQPQEEEPIFSLSWCLPSVGTLILLKPITPFMRPPLHPCPLLLRRWGLVWEALGSRSRGDVSILVISPVDQHHGTFSFSGPLHFSPPLTQRWSLPFWSIGKVLTFCFSLPLL